MHKSIYLGPDYTTYKYFCLMLAHSNNIAHFVFSFTSDLVVFANFKMLKNKVVFFLHGSIPFEPSYCIILEVTLETMSFQRYLQKLILSSNVLLHVARTILSFAIRHVLLKRLLPLIFFYMIRGSEE